MDNLYKEMNLLEENMKKYDLEFIKLSEKNNHLKSNLVEIHKKIEEYSVLAEENKEKNK